jgi:hypothetical protein
MLRASMEGASKGLARDFEGALRKIERTYADERATDPCIIL